MSCLLGVSMGGVKKGVKMRMERVEVRFSEEKREWRLLGLLYKDDQVSCGEFEGNLRVMKWAKEDV